MDIGFHSCDNSRWHLVPVEADLIHIGSLWFSVSPLLMDGFSESSPWAPASCGSFCMEIHSFPSARLQDFTSEIFKL